MPLQSYGVLRARAVDRRREGGTDSPHYQLHLVDDAGVHYRAAVNVLSGEAPSELLYLTADAFDHPVTAQLATMPDGWTLLPPHPGTANLDFIRGNLFDHERMRVAPPDVAGPDNDLADVLDHFVLRAIGDEAARLFVFGEPWGPESIPDKIFGFTPGGGVHDVHMNQGNGASHRGDDGVWQDGGLLVHFPAANQWVAVFLAFQSQAWHTDDITGHSVVEDQKSAGRVRIVGALVNPSGPAPEAETVTLLNASPATIDLTGWTVTDRLEQTMKLDSMSVPAGECVRVPLQPPVQLGNRGGLLTLVDPAGLKVDGIAYTKEEAADEGWTLTF